MESLNPAQPSQIKKVLLFLVKLVLIVAVFYFIYLQFRANWNDIKTYDWAVESVWLLLLSVICALFSLLLFAATWRIVVKGFGDQISLPVAFKISYLSNLGRYMPGRIWQLFGIIYVARQYGLTAEKATASFIISQLFTTVSAFLILAVSAQIKPAIIIDQIAFMGKGSAYLFSFLMALLSLVVVVWPNKILAITNYILRRMARPELRFSIDKKVAPVIFLGYCVAWIFYGAALWMFIKSIVAEADIDLISSVGIFAGSYQIGYLALFAPGGIGPRELVMGQMLLPYLPGVAPMVAILSRIWTTVIEIAATLLSTLIKK